MSTEFYANDEVQIEDVFEECFTPKPKFDAELMKCGKVFLCFITEDFVFFCGLCKNTTSKYTVFEEFANHIRETHLIVASDDYPNDGEIKEQFSLTDKKLPPEHKPLTEIEIEYLNCDEDVEKSCPKEHFEKPVILNLNDDNNFVQTILEPKLYLPQWSDRQVLQFIDLYRQQECLWNVESTLYHKSKVKEDAYQQMFQKFNDIHPNALDDINSVKNAIKKLLDFFSDFEKEQQQSISVSSNREIHERLQFLKNTYREKSLSISETTYASETDLNTFTEADSIDLISDNENSNDMNILSDSDTKLSDLKYCPICRVSFENLSDLKTHLSNLSWNLRKKTCDICGTDFEDRGSLITHLRVHEKEKHFLCKVCSKRFVTTTELQSHSRMHSDEMPFVCETCGLQFKYLNRLETHKLLHGEPSFECTDCNKKFLLKRHLAYHLRKHGPVEPATCGTCRKRFRNKDSLLRHERKIHKIMKRRRSRSNTASNIT